MATKSSEDQVRLSFNPFRNAGIRKQSFVSDSIHDIDTDIDLNYSPTTNRSRLGSSQNLGHKPSPTGSASSNGRSRPSLFMDDNHSNGDVLISGIFEIDGKTFDTTMKSNKLILHMIGSSKKVPESIRKKQIVEVAGENAEIQLAKVFGVTMKRMKPRKISSNKLGACQGIELHSCSEYDGNKLKYDVTLLTHPSEQVCNQWLEKIKPFIRADRRKPSTLRVYINNHAGSKKGKMEFKEKILPILIAANISIQEFSENFTIAECEKDIKALDFSLIDGILVVGGDGTAKTIVNAVLQKIQLDNGIQLNEGETFIASSLPIGIIPCGHTNHISHTVHGTSDLITAALHCVQGQTITSDVCSISKENDKLQFVFNAHYGFGGNLLNFAERYKAVGQAKFHAAIAKGLSKAKLRSYGCEIRYKLASSTCGNPNDGNYCRSGCTICNIDCITPRHEGSIYSDSLQDFDPLDSSANSTSMTAMKLEGEREAEETIKGSFMNISVFANPALNSLAPLGLSKYTHFGDGCMDLVLVDETDRKNFIRFIKRHGNSKSQFDFPFVHVCRVKEVQFHIRVPVGWNYKDHNYSEIDYELKRRRELKTSADEPIRVIDELQVTDLQIESDSDDDFGDDDLGSVSATASISSDRVYSAASSISSADQPTEESQDSNGSKAAGYVHPIFRSTASDRMRQKRKEKDMKKELKAKAKEESTSRTVWNFDNTACIESDLTFRCHQKLVLFYGALMNAATETENVTCFSAL